MNTHEIIGNAVEAIEIVCPNWKTLSLMGEKTKETHYPFVDLKNYYNNMMKSLPPAPLTREQILAADLGHGTFCYDDWENDEGLDSVVKKHTVNITFANFVRFTCLVVYDDFPCELIWVRDIDTLINELLAKYTPETRTEIEDNYVELINIGENNKGYDLFGDFSMRGPGGLWYTLEDK